LQINICGSQRNQSSCSCGGTVKRFNIAACKSHKFTLNKKWQSHQDLFDHQQNAKKRHKVLSSTALRIKTTLPPLSN
jgi:hypothetical protein